MTSPSHTSTLRWSPPSRPPGARVTVEERRRAWMAAGWQPAVIVCFIALGATVFSGSDVFPLLTLAGIYGIAVCGVSILAGLGGQITLGHAAFMAIGAYSSAITTTTLGWPPLAGVLVGLVAAAVLAVATSPLLRLGGWYLALATIALAFLVQRTISNLPDATGGVNGIYGIPTFSLGQWRLEGGVAYFVAAWALVLLFFLLGRNVAGSRYGRALAAIHKDASAAAALGINPGREKAILWVAAALPAALAGSMFAHYSAYIAPSDFDFSVSLLLFTAVVIGGQRSIFGGLLVVVVMMVLAGNTTQFWTLDLMEAVAMIVVYLASPNGLAGVVESVTRRVRLGGAEMLETRNLTVEFGGVAALSDVTLHIPTGSVVGLIGPNGAGKSTFISATTGAVLPARGEVRWLGERLSGLRPYQVARRGVARTYQHAHLFGGLSALENVMIGAHGSGRGGIVSAMLRSPRWRRDEETLAAIAMEKLEAVGAASLAERASEDLTAGQQRLVAVARALASSPTLLLLDEPAAGLTDAERADLAERLGVYFGTHDLTVLIIEHNLGFLLALATRIVVFDRGRVLADGEPSEVRSNPAVITAYLGVGNAQD